LQLSVQDALDTLVNQFADPLSFLREVVQNAIDAGSPEVEVGFELETDPGGASGLMTIRIDDFGEGMDKEIIDTRLLRLFSSSKDGDFTKIGRFGIGFVSVFAIQPDAVVVDTSRHGESWRVLFDAQRRYQRLRLEYPVEGTQIRLLKKVSAEEFEELRARARKVLGYWCKHASAEIRFEGEPINEPFAIDSPCMIEHQEQGTRAVLGLTESEQGSFGFYNRGLTLLEGSEGFFEYVAFKIDSRYLEHTLTRDNVLRDANFDKAMRILHGLVERELPKRLFELLHDAARAEEEAHDALYRAAAAWITAQPKSNGRPALASSLAEIPVLPTVNGRLVSLRACQAAQGDRRIFFEPDASPLTEAMAEEYLLVACAARGGRHRLLRAIIGEIPRRATRAFCLPVPAQDDLELRRWRPLQTALHRLLESYGAKVKEVTIAHLAYPGSPVSRRIAISQRNVGELTSVPDTTELPTSFFSRGRVIVLNADHPAVGPMVELAHHEPQLAAYLTAKLFFLPSELTPSQDGKLARLAWEARCHG